VRDELSSSTTGTAASGAASVGWSGSRRAASRVNREQMRDGRVGGGCEPSSTDAAGTSATVKTSRPWRSAEEEGPGATVQCP
jgi:hypothetical protein